MSRIRMWATFINNIIYMWMGWLIGWLMREGNWNEKSSRRRRKRRAPTCSLITELACAFVFCFVLCALSLLLVNVPARLHAWLLGLLSARARVCTCTCTCCTICFTWTVWQRHWRVHSWPPGPQPDSLVRACSPGCSGWRQPAVLWHRRQLQWRDLKVGKGILYSCWLAVAWFFFWASFFFFFCLACNREKHKC